MCQQHMCQDEAPELSNLIQAAMQRLNLLAPWIFLKSKEKANFVSKFFFLHFLSSLIFYDMKKWTFFLIFSFAFLSLFKFNWKNCQYFRKTSWVAFLLSFFIQLVDKIIEECSVQMKEGGRGGKWKTFHCSKSVIVKLLLLYFIEFLYDYFIMQRNFSVFMLFYMKWMTSELKWKWKQNIERKKDYKLTLPLYTVSPHCARVMNLFYFL